MLVLILTPEYFLSLPWGPITNIDFVHLYKKYHSKNTKKIFKNIHVGLKLEWGLQDKYISIRGFR